MQTTSQRQPDDFTGTGRSTGTSKMVENTGELQEKQKIDAQALEKVAEIQEKPTGELQETTGKLQVLPVKTDELPVKTHSRQVPSYKVTTNVTENAFKLYSSLAETLCNQSLTKEASMYHCLKYAVKLFTDLVLATAQRAQEKARVLQNARRANKIK